MALDMDVVKNIVDYATPMFLKRLNSFDIGKIVFEGLFVDNINFNFQVKDLNTIKASYSVTDNAIKMHIHDISGTITVRFGIKYFHLSKSGTFKLTIEYNGASLDTLINPIGQNVDGRNLLALSFKYLNFHIHSDKILFDIG